MLLPSVYLAMNLLLATFQDYNFHKSSSVVRFIPTNCKSRDGTCFTRLLQ